MTSIKDELEVSSTLAQLNLIEFIDHQDLLKQSISLEDLFGFPHLPVDSDLDLNAEELILMENLETSVSKVQQHFNLSPPEEGEIAQKHGFQAPKDITKEHPYLLHYVAKSGDVVEIEKLIKAGFDVNKEDSLSSRPLYVAAMYGHENAVKVLLKHGAEIHDVSYTGQTALHIALINQHYQVARTLILEGKADPNTLNSHGQTAINMICNEMMEQFDPAMKKDTAFEKKTNELIKTLDVASSHCGKNCLYLIPTELQENVGLPVSMHLRIFAAKSPSAEIRQNLLKLAEKISAFDHTEEQYILVKNFLNTFPTGGVYAMRVDNGPDGLILVRADGNSELIATRSVRDSIGKFLESLKSTSTDMQKIAMFEKLYATYSAAEDFISHIEDKQAANKMVEKFNNGETVLLPSGWDGHFVTVFLSKKQALLGVGNSGDRYEDNPSGIAFHHMNNPAKFDAKFMHDTVINEKQMALEHDAIYEYELIEKVDQINKPDQEHGNCTLESHRDAIEGILYVELLSAGVKSEQAKKLAAGYFLEWDQFHGKLQLDNLLAEEPGLSVKALMDVFIELHKKIPSSSSPKYEISQARKIAQALASDHYSPEFKYWLNKASPEEFKVMRSLYEKHGVDVKGVLKEDAPSSGFFDFLGKVFNKIGLLSIEKSNPLSHQSDLEHSSVDTHSKAQAGHPAVKDTHYHDVLSHEAGPLLNMPQPMLEPAIMNEQVVY